MTSSYKTPSVRPPAAASQGSGWAAVTSWTLPNWTPWAGSTVIHAALFGALFLHGGFGPGSEDAATEYGRGESNGTFITDVILDFTPGPLESPSEAAKTEAPVEHLAEPPMQSISSVAPESVSISGPRAQARSPEQAHGLVLPIKEGFPRKTQGAVKSASLITDGAGDAASGTTSTASTAKAAFADAAAAFSASGVGGPIPSGPNNSIEPTGVLFGPKPPYPLAARRAGFEGAVVLRVLVDEAGAPKVAEVRQSSGRNDCDESAKRTIENKWRFEPAPSPGVELVERQVVVRYTLQG